MGNDVTRRPLNVKRGVAGALMLIILGIPNAARSDAPLLVFAETILFALVFAVPLLGGAVALRPLRAKPHGAGDMPPLNFRRAVLVGLVVSAIAEATVSLRSSMPLSTFVNRTGSDGDSIALKEDGVHERHNPSPPVPAAVSV